MEKSFLENIPAALVWAVILQIIATIIIAVKRDSALSGVISDLKNTKEKFDKDLKAANDKIEKNHDIAMIQVKEEVNKLETANKQLSERQSKVEFQILERLSDLSAKVGKIEGMLTNTVGNKG